MNGQLNVAQITDKQPAPACHFTINCVVEGFPVQLEGQGRADDLRALVARLKAIGAEPPQARPEPTKAAGVPVCPVHNSPMKPSRKPGKFYCAKKADDGEYCREVA